MATQAIDFQDTFVFDEWARAGGLRVTEEEFAMMDFGENRVELVNGEVEIMAPAGWEHGKLSSELGWLLRSYTKQNPVGEIVGAETGFRLAPGTVRAPDVGVVLSERIQALREQSGQTNFPGFLPLAPDLAVEIISPGDRAADVSDKVADYFAHGTRLLWFFYPATRSVHVYTSPTQITILDSSQTLDGGAVLPGFSCSISEIFAVL